MSDEPYAQENIVQANQIKAWLVIGDENNILGFGNAICMSIDR